MTDLPHLISRLREAKGADRELGREVLLACGWRKTCVGHFHGPLYYWSSPDGRTSFDDNKFRYHDPTASVDAALTLVPAQASGELTFSAAGPPFFSRARLWDWRRGPLAVDKTNEWKSEGNRPPALALCIAALEARAAMEADHE